ncbi:RNA polymerase sigma factor SigZ [bacterium]|nr:RNA polymerase sigma factor SigZ [Chloroflexi bacterium CFX6]RIL11874.1 MAG: RNA polymerase sigma factor SigZ [bacterium]
MTAVAIAAPAASGAVWERFGAQVRGFVARRLDDPDAVDDVTQDVFLKLHAGLGDLRDADRLAPWLFQIARRAVIDHHRRHGGRHATAVDLDEAGADPRLVDDADAVRASAADRAAERQVAAFVGGLVDGLPEHYRQAVRLSEIDGHTQREVADRLGLSVSGAKSRIQRGRAILRERLLECCHIELDRRGHVIDFRPRVACCPLCACG